MMAMTTSNSISVKPRTFRFLERMMTSELLQNERLKEMGRAFEKELAPGQQASYTDSSKIPPQLLQRNRIRTPVSYPGRPLIFSTITNTKETHEKWSTFLGPVKQR